MAQYSTGKATFTNNSATVEGNASVDWITASNVKTGDLIKKKNENVFYTVTSVVNTATLTISPVYAGTTQSNVNYVIIRDFTSNLQLPEMSYGDIDFQDQYTRAVRKLDEVVASKLRKTYSITSGSGRANYAVGLSATPNFVKVANASAGSDQVSAIGFIETDNQTTVDVVFNGPLSGFTNLTAGSRYYLASTDTSINITTTPPSTASYIVQYLGRAETSSILNIQIDDYIIL